ncbi:MAG: hypothetical protein L6437_15255, partial [Kiritimatiellae bacterium]|nr:hypothetical protein [Kiritimatiellia bacterium]
PSSATVTIVDNDDPPEYQADIEVSEFKWVPKVMQKLEHPSMISFVLRNDGPSDMKPPDTQVEARFYLSGNMIFGDGDDILVGTKQGDVTLAAGDQMTVRYSGQAHNTDVTIP